jgi:hypothetical protein
MIPLKSLEKLWLDKNKVGTEGEMQFFLSLYFFKGIVLVPTWCGEGLSDKLRVLSLFGCNVWRVPFSLSKLTQLDELSQN